MGSATGDFLHQGQLGRRQWRQQLPRPHWTRVHIQTCLAPAPDSVGPVPGPVGPCRHESWSPLGPPLGPPTGAKVHHGDIMLETCRSRLWVNGLRNPSVKRASFAGERPSRLVALALGCRTCRSAGTSLECLTLLERLPPPTQTGGFWSSLLHGASMGRARLPRPPPVPLPLQLVAALLALQAAAGKSAQLRPPSCKGPTRRSSLNLTWPPAHSPAPSCSRLHAAADAC